MGSSNISTSFCSISNMGRGSPLKRLTIPTVDAGVEPAYVFSPRVLKPGANYPGLVMVHGSYHGALDPAIFGLIAAAVDHGYIVISRVSRLAGLRPGAI